MAGKKDRTAQVLRRVRRQERVTMDVAGEFILPNASGAPDHLSTRGLKSRTLPDVSDPVNAQDAATKNYVDTNAAAVSHTHVEVDITDLQSYLLNITGENLSSLSDVTITSIAAGELLKWSGTAWINNTLAEAGIAAASHTHTESDITDLQSYLLDITGEALSSLSDVTITSIAGGEILKWSGTAWINNTLAEAGISAAGHTHVEADITDLHSAVTLAGTPDYITISGQTITRGTIDIGDDTNLTVTTPITLTGDDIGLTTVPVGKGGTSRTSHTAYAVICGGTASTAAQQSIAGLGSSGQVLTSNGAGALPTFQAAGGGGEWCTVLYGGEQNDNSEDEYWLIASGGSTDAVDTVITTKNVHNGTPWAGTVERVFVHVVDDSSGGKTLDQVEVYVDEVSVFDSTTGQGIAQDQTYEGAPGDSIALDDRLAVSVSYTFGADSATAMGGLVLKKSSPPKQCPYCMGIGKAVSTDTQGGSHTYYCHDCDEEVRKGVWDTKTGLLREIMADITDPENVKLCCGQSAEVKKRAGRKLILSGLYWHDKISLKPGQKRVYAGHGVIKTAGIPNWVGPKSLREELAELKEKVNRLLK